MVPEVGAFFSTRMTSEYHFPGGGTSDSYVLPPSNDVSPQPGCFE